MGRIIVIGGANIDICGTSLNALRDYDSNPGTISISFGGVGRNIAENCVLFGQQTDFVTVFSSDNYGRLLKQDCENLGMNCSFSAITDEYPSSMYLALLDHNHDMKVAMSDMRILRAFTTEMLDRVLKTADSDDIIIIDANLDMECIRYITENAPCRIAADPVSAAKAQRLADVLGHIDIFKPNRYEARQMSGITVSDIPSGIKALEWYLDKGVREVLISLAEDGILLAAEGKMYHFSHKRIDVQNATGGGDALLGAYVSERRNGRTPRQAARFAAAAAVTVIERQSDERRTISRAMIEENEKRAELKEQLL